MAADPDVDDATRADQPADEAHRRAEADSGLLHSKQLVRHLPFAPGAPLPQIVDRAKREHPYEVPSVVAVPKRRQPSRNPSPADREPSGPILTGASRLLAPGMNRQDSALQG